jgi:ABC-type sugar transport system ATPase subunit
VKALRDVNLASTGRDPRDLRRERRRQVDADEGAQRRLSARQLRGRDRLSRRGAPIRDIADSEHLGIIIIHQELALVPLLSIAENIFLGNEPPRWASSTGPTRRSRAPGAAGQGRAEGIARTLITNLGVGKQQLVEIAKALAKKVQAADPRRADRQPQRDDSDALLDLLLEFKAQGITSILISHKLNEIAKVADSITVLRDGTTVETLDCRPRRSARAASSRAWSAARCPTAIRRASRRSARRCSR